MSERMPYGMEEYLSAYGWHFNKKLCEWAVSKMRRRDRNTGDEESIRMLSKEDLDTVFRRYGIEPSDFVAYDAVYVYHMAMSDYFGNSLIDERHLVLFVKDYLGDIDGYKEVAMTRFYADCIGRGEMPDWEDCL